MGHGPNRSPIDSLASNPARLKHLLDANKRANFGEIMPGMFHCVVVSRRIAAQAPRRNERFSLAGSSPSVRPDCRPALTLLR